MLAFQALLAVASMATTALAQCPPRVADPGYGVPPFYGYPPHVPFKCGKTDAYFTGLPPNHPAVISQGFNPSMVAGALVADRAKILAAGYNVKIILQGPEEPISNVANGLYSSPSGVIYDVYVGGYGLRGSSLVNVTAEFENTISVLRERLPNAPFGFNNSPNSSLAALQRVAPIQGDCSKTPGKDYGTYIYCSPQVCTVPYSPQVGTTYP